MPETCKEFGEARCLMFQHLGTYWQVNVSNAARAGEGWGLLILSEQHLDLDSGILQWEVPMLNHEPWDR